MFLDHLVGEISTRVIKGRFTAENLIPSKLRTIDEQKANAISDVFSNGIGDRQVFLDEVARWKVKWSMAVGQRPQHQLNTFTASIQFNSILYSVCNVAYRLHGYR
jgi:hypothetical protein